jgi:transcriptional regulator with XRE-family HTH domain
MSSISRSYFADIEKNRYNPSIATLEKISLALNMDINELMNDTTPVGLVTNDDLDFYYYVVYEYEVNNVILKRCFEYKADKLITQFTDIQELVMKIQKKEAIKKTPVIVFYSLLRNEVRTS